MMQEINKEVSSSPQRPQVFIALNGFIYFMYSAIVPNLSAMKYWLGISAAITLTYIALTLPILVKDGKGDKMKDYNIQGNGITKFFNALGAMTVIVTCHDNGLLPEMQATLREPVVRNMRKALSMQYSVGLMFYYGMTVAGYWVYGSSVSEYLPRELQGPRWGRILINSLAFLQCIISQHMFAAPVHEAVDTKFLNLEERMDSRNSVARQIFLRAIVLRGNTLIASAFPFMEDFLTLGCFGLWQLTFVFPSLISLQIKRKSAAKWKQAWHWALVVLFSALTILTTAAAVRLIIHNTRTYNFFADT